MMYHADRPPFRALVVDDEPVVLRMVAFALQQEGFACDTAADGEQALTALNSKDFDLLVTDLRMPNKHGHALVTDVLSRINRPRVIVHTAVNDARLTKDLIVRGIDDIVFKPTDYAAFAAKAKGLLMRYNATSANREDDSSPVQHIAWDLSQLFPVSPDARQISRRLTFEVRAQPLNNKFKAVAEPFMAVTRELSATDIDLLHDDQVGNRYLKLQIKTLSVAPPSVMIEVLRCQQDGRYYNIEGKFARISEN